jgi:hypothetical protein
LELLFATTCFFAITTAAAFIYYWKIKQAQEEYEESKDYVRIITLGFSRQIKKVSELLTGIEVNSSDASLKASEALRISEDAMKIAKNGEKERLKFSSKFNETDKNLLQIREEIQNLAKRPVITSKRIDVDAPIPLKQEAVLDRLTPTEFEVLSIIEDLGEGSVPQIREKIQKTREHTARLLKKLFENGFIDRNTNRMPYRYSIRKEIKDLIHQQKEKMISL